MRGDELVRLAMERLGVDGPTALADAIQLPGRQAPRRISRWLDGENAPDYEATLLLLRAVGLLRDEAGPVSQPQPQTAEPADLAATVARLEKVAETLHNLRVQASEEIVTQLKRQSDLLGTIERAAASLPAAQPATPSRRAGKRTA